MLPCCPALTLRGLLSTRDNMLELNGVSSPRHFSLILISLPLTFCYSMYESVYLCLPLLSTVPVFLHFPSFCPLNPPIQWSWQEQCPRLPRPELTLIRHSLCCSPQKQQRWCPPFPSPHCGCASCSCLQGSSFCHQAPSEVVSRRDYSLIPGDLEIFLRDDVRHVK